METLDFAETLASAGRHAEARRIVVKIIKRDHHNVRALLLLAEVSSSPKEKRQALERLLKLRPGHPKAEAMLAKLGPPEPEETGIVKLKLLIIGGIALAISVIVIVVILNI